MVLSSYSQKTYPLVLINEGDTVIAITAPQAKFINRTFQIKDNLGGRIILLKRELLVYEDIISYYEKTFTSQESQIGDLKGILSIKDSELRDYKKELSVSVKYAVDLDRKHRRVKKVAIVGCSVSLTLIIVLLFN